MVKIIIIYLLILSRVQAILEKNRLCDCMEQKGKIIQEVKKSIINCTCTLLAKLTMNKDNISTTSVVVHATCTKVIPASSKVNTVTIEVTTPLSTHVYSQRLLIMCDGISHNLTFLNLNENTSYNITAIWTSEQNLSCCLDSFITKSCKDIIL